MINTTEAVEDQVFPSTDSIFPIRGWASGGSSISLTGKTVRQFEVAGKSEHNLQVTPYIDSRLYPVKNRLAKTALDDLTANGC